MQSKVGKENTAAIGDVISYTRLKDLNFIWQLIEEVFAEWIPKWASKCFQRQRCNNMALKIFSDTITWVNTSCIAGWKISYTPEVSNFS